MSRQGLTAVGLALVAFALGCSSGGDGPSAQTIAGTATSEADDRDLAACVAIVDAGEARTCYAAALSDLMRAADDPGRCSRRSRPPPTRIRADACSATATGSCTRVGREFAVEHGVTLESLMTYLPRTNEPGCSAGFAHELVTGVAPDIDLSRPQDAAAVCNQTATRYQRYSCVTASATRSCGSSGRI